MSSSSGFHAGVPPMNAHDRNSPLSSSEPISGSTSPHILKPQAVLSHKQRSLSMNSVTSNHSNSNHNRSMSIISLGSPRNSIVSIDDGIMRTTRNNSNTSLVSLLNNQFPVPHLPSHEFDNHSHNLHHGHNHTDVLFNSHSFNVPENYIIANRFRHQKNSSAILSDDDSESESSKVITLGKNSTQFNKDFSFNYNNAHPDSNKDSNQKTESAPSPLSLNVDAFANSLPRPNVLNHSSSSSSPTSTSSPKLPTTTPTNLNKKKNSPSTTPSPSPPKDKLKLLKKTKAPNPLNSKNLIQQSIYLKKKMIYSKDLQIELLSSANSPHNQNIDKHLDSKFIDIKRSPNSNSPLLPSSKYLILNSVSSNNQNNDQPVMNTLKQQNKLIVQLNRKWNKSIIENSNSPLHHHSKAGPSSSTLKNSSTSITPVSPRKSRKRSRRDSFCTDEEDEIADAEDVPQDVSEVDKLIARNNRD